ncbi:MAG TPA: hypothetical protein VFQ77_05300 [Pseudonocardiaceae bacterium]|nr:hypothetical protein [Pseudonocardiaceae bacterium]
MPSGNAGWVRAVALLAVVAMVASLGYAALVTIQAPTWLMLVLIALLVGLPLWLLVHSEDRSR